LILKQIIDSTYFLLIWLPAVITAITCRYTYFSSDFYFILSPLTFVIFDTLICPQNITYAIRFCKMYTNRRGILTNGQIVMTPRYISGRDTGFIEFVKSNQINF
jgi:hypothetical protein